MSAREFNDSPAWLIAAIDQKAEVLKRAVLACGFGNFQIAMMPLSEPPPGTTDEEFLKWEQSCDHCKEFVPGDLWSGTASREIHGMQVIIMFGICTRCKELP